MCLQRGRHRGRPVCNSRGEDQRDCARTARHYSPIFHRNDGERLVGRFTRTGLFRGREIHALFTSRITKIRINAPTNALINDPMSP
jgi:hypothetical protein